MILRRTMRDAFDLRSLSRFARAAQFDDSQNP
jgi:hypothetical protein